MKTGVALAFIIIVSTSAIELGTQIAYGLTNFEDQQLEGDYKLLMQMDLMQIPTNDSSTEYDFKVMDYQIQVDGKDVTILKEDNVRNHRISMDKQNVYLSNLGMYENRTVLGDGKIETRYVNLGGGVDIEKIQEDPSIPQTIYFLEDGNMNVGDEIFFDYGVDNDQGEILGFLSLTPSFTRPNMTDGYLWLGLSDHRPALN